MKKWMFLFLTLLLTMGVLTGCGANKDNNSGSKAGKNKDFTVAMVTDIGGVNDKSFNQSAWEGLQKFGKKNHLVNGKDYKYLQSTSSADYAPNLNQLVQEKYDLIYGIGYLMQDDVSQVAKQNPKAHFAIIDAVATDDQGKPLSNVTNVTFKEQQGSFLVGVVAGLTTKTDKVGFVGGDDSDLIKKFKNGFKAGVMSVNPRAVIFEQSVGSFSAPDKAQTIADTMYSKGADIIYAAAGGSGNGVFTEAKTRKKNGQNVWVIGVDRDQYNQGLPENVTLTSMVKRVDNAVVQVSTDAMKGNYKGGKILEFGLKDNGVGIAPTTKNLNKSVLKKVNAYKKKIINGKINIPKTDKEYTQFLSSQKK